MNQNEFQEAASQYRHEAEQNAMLFECLYFAFTAISKQDFEKWTTAQIKLDQLIKDNPMLVRLRDMFATIADCGYSDSETRIMSDLFDSLDLTFFGE